MARAISIEEQYQNDAPTSSEKVEYPQKLVYAIKSIHSKMIEAENKLKDL